MRVLTVRELLLSLEWETIVVGYLPLGDSHKEEKIFESRDGDGSDLTFKHGLVLLDVDTGSDHLLHGWEDDGVGNEWGGGCTGGSLRVPGNLAS